ncbi:MAG: hypothetical protein WKF79_01510 [Nocardioides sp.]
MGALLFGRLELDEGCLVVVEVDTNVTFIPMFPEDAVQWNEQTQTLTYGGVDFRVGSDVTFGGGGSDPPTQGDNIPDACPSELPAFVIS